MSHKDLNIQFILIKIAIKDLNIHFGGKFQSRLVNYGGMAGNTAMFVYVTQINC